MENTIGWLFLPGAKNDHLHFSCFAYPIRVPLKDVGYCSELLTTGLSDVVSVLLVTSTCVESPMTALDNMLEWWSGIETHHSPMNIETWDRSAHFTVRFVMMFQLFVA